MTENEIDKILKDEALMNKSRKLAENLAFILQGENMLAGLAALSFVLKETLKQQDFMTEDDLLTWMKLCREKEEKKND